MTPRMIFIVLSLTIWPLSAINLYFYHDNVINFTIISLIAALGWFDTLQKRDAVLRDYPVIGHIRYLLRFISPELHQYFIENNTDGKPFNKNMIELINLRADNKAAFHPFGTEQDFYRDGLDWTSHSMFPKQKMQQVPRVTIGGDNCTQPYSASILNISAMSFGAISENAIKALNEGAKRGNFYHNTGEGGLTPHHLACGGDITLQIGTGNFGCRNSDGSFNDAVFAEKAAHRAVKMIEIKLSQGAKPGHGGMLPAAKNTQEIASIRMVEPHTDVLSPAFNPAFSTAAELIAFIIKIRELGKGKPVGIKLCIGNTEDFTALIEAFIEQQVFPDFITVDAAEGGTGAAPLDYSNHIGMRGEDALCFVDNTLKDFSVREKIRVIYAGKVTSGFTLFKALCLGADLCNSARGFMFSLGCIQSLRCHTDTCPTGIATQNKNMQRGLVSSVKAIRVENYHNNTINDFAGIASTVGIGKLEDLTRHLVHKQKPSLALEINS